ncbi:ABC transporter substrate-binding protein [Streptococcus macacae]|uniref:NMT1/THI5-like protein n=1 Tax=Streptococcus macacae NCTC 11558 TaxID=764298 RepID=G5JUT1_9STRE|nr:ABC transporter substrate-binding protein [Streptococcus macacae]EHJ52238.1 NMT1/THI5-like protein [Streptococcus macacae NCTC 11558]SUN78896.1 ABC transporter substrate-binding protein [Streptococcus macacae NCTC 11558]
MKKYLTPKFFGLGLMLLTLSVGLAACSNSSSSTSKNYDASEKDPYVLKISENSDLCGAPQQIAVEKGFFREVGLKYKVVKIGQDTSNLDALNAGKIDASNSLMASIIQPLANGAKLKITTGLHTGCLQLLTKDGKIKSAADLKGKKIGVTAVAGSPAIFAKRVLAKSGLKVSDDKGDVSFVTYQSDQLGQVLDKGEVDAIALGDPDTEVLKKQYHFKTLANSSTDKGFKDEYCCVAYVSNDIAKKHPAVTAKYTLAMQKATNWIQKHKEQTAAIQLDKNYVAGNKDSNLTSLNSYTFKPSYSGAYDSFDTVASDLRKIGILSDDVDLKALRTNSFLKVKDVK